MTGHEGIAAVAGAAASLTLTAAATVGALGQALPIDPGANIETGLAAFLITALAGVAGAFLWLVRLIANGTLVHRDPAASMQRVAAAVDASSDAIRDSTATMQRLSAREERMLEREGRMLEREERLVTALLRITDRAT